MFINKIKIIFFDMGDTLLRFHEGPTDEVKDEIGIKEVASYLSQFSSDISFSSVKEDFFIPWSQCFEKRRVTLEEYPVEDYLNNFLSRYGAQLTKDEAIQTMRRFHIAYNRYVKTEPQLSKTLNELKKRGYRIGVISNCYLFDEVMIDHFKSTGIHDFIDTYVFSYYLRKRKPRPEIYLEALNRLNAKPEEGVMVGNLLKEDVWGAQQVGMQGIWLNKEMAPNETKIIPDATIKKIADLLRIKD